MKKVALLTDFYNADPSYSLTIVVEEQLHMLKSAGYAPIGIVEDIFQPVRIWNDIELRHIPHGIPRDNRVTFYEGWEDSVRKFHEAYENILHDVDVIITHDLIYQGAMIWHNLAARQYAKDHPDKTWLHWIHSATASPIWTNNDSRLAPAQVHFPGSKIVYPNDWSVPRVAQNFKCEVDDVAVVPHSTDVCGFLGFDPATVQMVKDKLLLEADVILVYPVRLDRGKQVEYVLRTAAAIKGCGRSARAIIVDFHSTGGDKVAYRNKMKELAIDLGLNRIEYTFTSEYKKEWMTSVPRNVVRDLMLICNAFIMPSRSETYSLIAQEAALCGAFLVLNRDFPAMRSIYGKHAAFYQFSSNVDALTGFDGETNVTYNDIDGYFYDIAQRVLYELDHNAVMNQRTRIRRDRNPTAVFKRHIEPLLYWREG